MNIDGWGNLLSGFGRKNSKRANNEFSSSGDLIDQTLADAYDQDGWVARITDAVPEDMTRQWLSFLPADKENEADAEAANAVADTLKALDAPSKFKQALAYSRLFGGSLMIVGIMDGQKLDKPVRKNLDNRELSYLRVVDRTDVELYSSVWDEDPRSPRYGQVEKYRVNLHTGKNTKAYTDIHHTRAVPFFGRPVPHKASNTLEDRYWGKNIIRPLWNSLSDFGITESALGELLQESNIGKYTIDGLSDMLAREGGEKEVLTRMEIMNASKSILNSVLLDTGEKYEEISKTFAGIAEVIDRLMMFLSGKSGIPVTRLFGRSPAGQNATGEGDMKNYYDMVRSEQQSKLMPPVRLLKDIVLGTRGSLPEQVMVELNPLVQPSQKEKTETEKMKAETAAIYIDRGVLDAEEAYERYLGEE